MSKLSDSVLLHKGYIYNQGRLIIFLGGFSPYSLFNLAFETFDIATHGVPIQIADREESDAFQIHFCIIWRVLDSKC